MPYSLHYYLALAIFFVVGYIRHLFIKKSITFIIFFLYQVQIKYPTNDLSFTDISQSEVQEKEVIVGIVTDIDLLHHVSQKESRSGSSSGGNFLVN